MVEFRRRTMAKMEVSHWWDNGKHQIGFGRGGLGYVVINREDFTELDRVLHTGMAAGTYCDIVNGELTDGECDGPTVRVGADGRAHFKVGRIGAAAIHVGTRVRAPSGSVTFECRNGSTVMGQSVYVVGSSARVGAWHVGRAVRLWPTAYPTWRRTVTLRRGQRVQWKCIKRSERDAANAHLLQWQSGANNELVVRRNGTLAVGSF